MAKNIEKGIVKENNPKLTLVKALKAIGKVLAAPFVLLSGIFEVMDQVGAEKTQEELDYEYEAAMADFDD